MKSRPVTNSHSGPLSHPQWSNLPDCLMLVVFSGENFMSSASYPIASRFRGFFPVVVDVETGGFNAQTDALLELAVRHIDMDDSGWLSAGDVQVQHIKTL